MAFINATGSPPIPKLRRSHPILLLKSPHKVLRVLIAQDLADGGDAVVWGAEHGLGLCKLDFKHQLVEGVAGFLFDQGGAVWRAVTQMVSQIGEGDGAEILCNIGDDLLRLFLVESRSLRLLLMLPDKLREEDDQKAADDPVGKIVRHHLLHIHFQDIVPDLHVVAGVEQQERPVVLQIDAVGKEGGDHTLVPQDIKKDILDGASAHKDIDDNAVVIYNGDRVGDRGGDQTQIALLQDLVLMKKMVDTAPAQHIDDLKKDVSVLKNRRISRV